MRQVPEFTGDDFAELITGGDFINHAYRLGAQGHGSMAAGFGIYRTDAGIRLGENGNMDLGTVDQISTDAILLNSIAGAHESQHTVLVAAILSGTPNYNLRANTQLLSKLRAHSTIPLGRIALKEEPEMELRIIRSLTGGTYMLTPERKMAMQGDIKDIQCRPGFLYNLGLVMGAFTFNSNRKDLDMPRDQFLSQVNHLF